MKYTENRYKLVPILLHNITKLQNLVRDVWSQHEWSDKQMKLNRSNFYMLLSLINFFQ